MDQEQQPNFTSGQSNFDTLVTVLKLGNQNMSQLIQQFTILFAAQCATTTSLGVINSTAGGNLLNIGTGYLISVSIIGNSTGTGFIYDSNTLVGLGSSAAMAMITPNSSGITLYNLPYAKGLVVEPSSTGGNASIVSVSYAPSPIIARSA